MVAPLSRAAVAVGADGIMVDVHPNPQAALCDGPQAVTPDEIGALVAEVTRLAHAMGRPMAEPKQNIHAAGE